MTKTALQRDVTRIKKLAEKGRALAADQLSITHDCTIFFAEIIDIAQAIDARTGRRDPSVRKKGKVGWSEAGDTVADEGLN